MQQIIEESDQTNVCSFCGFSPCFLERHGERHMERARRCELRTGNENKNVRFHLHKLIIRDRFGVLGNGNRVSLPRCMERCIKGRHPNEDGSVFIGHQERNR